MKLMHIMCAGLLAAAPMAGMAAGVGNQVDLYYLSGGIEVGVDDDGDGFGVKGQFAFADNLFFNGEYQSVGYDDSDVDLDQLRLGIGYNTSLNAQTVLYGLGEFARIKIDGGGTSESENGFGLHAGLQFNVNEAFGLNARIGYVDIGDFGDGVEFLVGASYAFSKPFGVFADYRVSKLDGDFGDIDLDDFRVGVRFTF